MFFYGDLDPFYNAKSRAVIESMQGKMDSVELYLDAGQAHVCDPALAIEAIRALLLPAGPDFDSMEPLIKDGEQMWVGVEMR